MGEFSITHLLLVVVVVLIFFGPSRLPQLGQSLGKAIKGFKEGLNEMTGEAKDVGPQSQIKGQEVAKEKTKTETHS